MKKTNAQTICSEYCIGCGLCSGCGNIPMTETDRGYLRPDFSEPEGSAIYEKVCPALVNSEASAGELWGKSLQTFAGWAENEIWRTKASSGGALTALAIYLLEQHLADAVLQVKANEDNPIKTQVQVSRTPEEVLQCCGSRYAISSPWLHLKKILEPDKTYVAIGKPCDIKALWMAREQDGEFRNVKYLLSFFCAGLPSKQANEKLLRELNCSPDECESLTYRGNGWPGYATAQKKDGTRHQMEYSKAWGGILGRDIHPFCRLCIDGIGEYADVACADGWYITDDGQPDFSERPGRNVVFARTEAGLNLLKAASADGMLHLEEWNNLDDLRLIQKYQFTRRTTMRMKLKAYRIMGKKIPVFQKEQLRELSKYADTGIACKMFLGTIKRIVKGKI